MKRFFRVITCMCTLLTFCAAPSLAFQELAHKAINSSAINLKLLSPQLSDYFKVNLGYSKVDDLVNGATIHDWFENAGAQEDTPVLRSRHHFLDPVNNNGFSGLVGGLFQLGDPSVVWAQKGLGQQTIGGAYSWVDARDYFYKALSSNSKTMREEQLAMSFRALGQVMHLISDMGVPEHTRNTSHIISKTIEPWLEEVLNKDTKTDLHAKYFSRISNAIDSPVYPDSSLVQQAGKFPNAPIPIANLFDFETYTGTNPDVTKTSQIGLAEYTNANFFSIDTIFKDYNYPSASEIIEYQETDSASGEIKTFIANTEVNHLAQAIVFKKYLVAGNTHGYTIVDDKIHADYLEKLLPRAVGYSGALIDYFYRGTIELSLPSQGIYAIAAPNSAGYTEIRLNARNSTPNNEEMTDGTLQLVFKYKMALSDPLQGGPYSYGPEQYIVVAEKNNIRTLSRTATTELVFDLTSTPLPLWAVDLYLQVVYHGKLGNETGAVVVGTKDISEPTPIDIVNDMDLICINNTIMTAGSDTAISAADLNHDGKADYDVFPHGLANVYMAFNGAAASSSNHQATFANIPPGSYGRIFVLGDYSGATPALLVSTAVTVQKLDVRDTFSNFSFQVDVDGIDAVDNQSGYPAMLNFRGLKSWWYTHYENPTNSTCDTSVTSPAIAGPVMVSIP